jgi:hypothetical protein
MMTATRYRVGDVPYHLGQGSGTDFVEEAVSLMYFGTAGLARKRGNFVPERDLAIHNGKAIVIKPHPSFKRQRT